jgi:hypothetical protein
MSGEYWAAIAPCDLWFPSRSGLAVRCAFGSFAEIEGWEAAVLPLNYARNFNDLTCIHPLTVWPLSGSLAGPILYTETARRLQREPRSTAVRLLSNCAFATHRHRAPQTLHAWAAARDTSFSCQRNAIGSFRRRCILIHRRANDGRQRADPFWYVLSSLIYSTPPCRLAPRRLSKISTLLDRPSSTSRWQHPVCSRAFQSLLGQTTWRHCPVC